MSDDRKCTVCGADLPPGEPSLGVCPRCLIVAALGEESGPDETVSFGFNWSGPAQRPPSPAEPTTATGGIEDRSTAPEARPPRREPDDRPLPFDPSVYRKFGEYELLRELGRGGMGVVYEARQPSLRRVVALKMILGAARAEPHDLRRFRAEAETIAVLDHPRIVPVHEVGEIGGELYFTMKRVDGRSLKQGLAGFVDRPREAARLMAEVADAVDYAHRRGVLHRDLKPSNILVDRDGLPMVIDFGLAMRVDADLTPSASGAVVGTPNYMAPEQAAGRNRDTTTLTDVYGLGSTLYATLTGHAPFESNNPLSTLKQVIEVDPPSPSTRNPKVDRDLETICRTSMAKDPTRRYASAAELAADLRRYLAGEPIRARPVSSAERLRLWARRHPAIATLSAGLAGAILVGFVATLVALRLAWRNEQRALEGEDLARRRDYAARIQLAHRDWKLGRTQNLLRLLEQTRPRGSEPDLRGFEWDWLASLPGRGATTLGGASGGDASIRDLAYSPDGSRIAACGEDATVRIWDRGGGTLLRAIENPGGKALALAYHPRLPRILVACLDRQVRIWDVETGALVRAFEGHPRYLLDLAVSPDGARVATAGMDRTLRVYEADTGNLVAESARHERNILAVEYSPDGKRLATASADHSARLWDAASLAEVRTLFTGGEDFTVVAFSPDGALVLTGGGARIRGWRADDGQLALSLTADHGAGVLGLAFDRSGRRFASAGFDQRVKLWDRTGLNLAVFQGHLGSCQAVAFHPDGQEVASAGGEGAIKLWDVDAGGRTRTIAAHGDTVMAVAFGADESGLLSVDGEGRAILAGAADGAIRRVATLGVDNLTRAAIAPGGRLVVATGEDGRIRAWDPGTEAPVRTLGVHPGEVTALAISPDGRRLATAGRDETIRLWSLPEGLLLRTWGLPGLEIFALAFRPDGRHLACSGRSSRPDATESVVLIRDAEQGGEVDRFAVPGTTLVPLAYSPDGQALAYADDEGDIRLRDPAGRRSLLLLQGHRGGVYTLAFSPDGLRLASAGFDGLVRLWELEEGQEVLALDEHREEVFSVAFDRTGRRLVTGGDDRTVKLWEAPPAR